MAGNAPDQNRTLRRIASTEFEQARDSMLRRFPTLRSINPTVGGAFNYDVEALDFGRVAMSRGLTTGFRGDRGATGDWTFISSLSGNVLYEDRRNEARVASGMRVLAPPGASSLTYGDGLVVLAVRFPGESIEETAAAMVDASGGGSMRVPGDPIAGLAVECGLTRAALAAYDAFSQPNLPPHVQERMRALHEELLLIEAAALLLGPAEAAPRDPDRARLDRAIGFMLDNLGQGIGPVQIASKVSGQLYLAWCFGRGAIAS